MDSLGDVTTSGFILFLVLLFAATGTSKMIELRPVAEVLSSVLPNRVLVWRGHDRSRTLARGVALGELGCAASLLLRPYDLGLVCATTTLVGLTVFVTHARRKAHPAAAWGICR